MDIQSFLLANCDDDKAKFDSKLISTKYKIYGVKTGLLENFAKNLTKTDFSFDNFKFESHEEILIAGMFLCYAKMELAGRLKLLERWLSFCDNWAT